jgi:dUTP pyrophosphatase
MVALYNHSKEDIIVADGERVAQMVIAPYIYAEYEEAEELEDTIRGEGGFGSTGVK